MSKALNSAPSLLDDLYGDTPPAQFRPLALVAQGEKIIARNWAGGTINDQVARIKHAFKLAVAPELVPLNLAARAPPAPGAPMPQFPT